MFLTSQGTPLCFPAPPKAAHPRRIPCVWDNHTVRLFSKGFAQNYKLILVSFIFPLGLHRDRPERQIPLNMTSIGRSAEECPSQATCIDGGLILVVWELQLCASMLISSSLGLSLNINSFTGLGSKTSGEEDQCQQCPSSR